MNKICALIFIFANLIAINVAELPDCSSEIDGTMFPDFTRCNNFYICLSGTAHNQACPNEMFFDIEINNCNIGDCSDSEEEISPPDGSTEEESIECPPPSAVPEITYIPSREECRRYFICVNGRPLRAYCRDGLYFNPVTRKCDFSENVECEFSSNEDSNEVTPEYPVDENGYPICPTTGLHFFPHPTVCKLYFSCFMGFRSVQQCTFQNNWDVVTNQCQIISNAICFVN